MLIQLIFFELMLSKLVQKFKTIRNLHQLDISYYVWSLVDLHILFFKRNTFFLNAPCTVKWGGNRCNFLIYRKNCQMQLCYTRIWQMFQVQFSHIRDHPPTLSHKCQLHYVNAVISESMRKSSVVPSGVPHFVEEDTWLCNYFFPKAQ